MRAPTPLDYAAWRARALGRITERVERAAVLALAGSVQGRDVLDVGCGDGTYAVLLAGLGARVTGLDASIPALRAAAARAAAASTRVSLVAADAGRLPFEAGTFDLVIAVTALCFVPDPERSVEEIARVLRPGGRLVVGELGRWSAWAAWRRLRGWLGSETWREARFWTPASLRRLVARAGLAPGRARGAAFHPPFTVAAAALAPLDPVLGRVTTLGASFVAVEAEKASIDEPAGA
ncbi:MAG TPA: class I SAM-dependent methyltransferase [Anaeromyxobacter sp.]